MKNKMLLKNCLSYILAVFIIQIECDKSEHDPTEIDSSLANTGRCYYFAYSYTLDFNAFKEIVPTAQYHEKATLKGYRLDFARVDELPMMVSTTMVVDETSEVLGALYSACVEDYEAYRDRNREFNGKNIARSATFTVQADNQKVKCNTLVTVVIPNKEDPIPEDRRPEKRSLDDLVKAMESADIDQNYIRKIASTPTQKPEKKKN